MTFSKFYHSTKSARAIKKLQSLVEKSTAQEAGLSSLAMAELQSLSARLRAATPEQKSSPAWLADVFALVREVSKRLLGLRHHDVQLTGGFVLAQGKLAEMRTGEGKTLAIAAPCIAAAFAETPVHVVTVNEYLAERDAETLRPLYEAFGLTVGIIKAAQTLTEKQAAYRCSIVYGVNHEFGFDYLRDNMAFSSEARVQRGLGFVVVDEVDSILIDEARTPLIISGLAPESEGSELTLDRAVRSLQRDTHYTVDEKAHSAVLNDAGYTCLEQLLITAGLTANAQDVYRVENLPLLQHVGQALLAHAVYRRDRHYVVQEGEIVIVDEATGRLMKGRRWGEGLHEAVEAKEGLQVKPRTLTQATITYQNFFGLYKKLSGLTGTAFTEAEEFVEIYGLETVVIPPNVPVIRNDLGDLVYATRKDKFAAIVAEVAARHDKGQPVLVGTASVADSERLARLLTAAGLPHRVLNARQNAQEADVIACAGMPGAITVATNMAGRGTDIVLGGHAELREPLEPATEASEVTESWVQRKGRVLAAGGLHVIGAERHESRRVDNQLRGRAGRQGDAGSSQFFLSLEDKLFRVFAADKATTLAKLVSPGEGVSSPIFDKVVSMAQRRMEEQGFQARRELLKFDRALSGQREALYVLRSELLADDLELLTNSAVELAELAADGVMDEWLANDWIPEDFDALAFKNVLSQTFDIVTPVLAWVYQDNISVKEIRSKVRELVGLRVRAWLADRTPADVRRVLLLTLDLQWVDHLTRLEELQTAIGLRSMAQQSPVHAFTLESKKMFEGMRPAWAFASTELFKDHANYVRATEGDTAASEALNSEQKVHLAQFQRWVTRNEACPCLSGKRFKFCHGRV